MIWNNPFNSKIFRKRH